MGKWENEVKKSRILLNYNLEFSPEISPWAECQICDMKKENDQR